MVRDGHSLREGSGEIMGIEVTLRVDGAEHRLAVDTRTTPLDALRERLGMTRVKKGCDHGQCGARTILLEGRRALSWLAPAVAHQDVEIITAEGLGDGDLHLLQRAFITHDTVRCGCCTQGLRQVRHQLAQPAAPRLARRPGRLPAAPLACGIHPCGCTLAPCTGVCKRCRPGMTLKAHQPTVRSMPGVGGHSRASAKSRRGDMMPC
jgi:aerobic-type carbon monoxide dehydrogenase small subunit (CoxS/CutS family)